MLTIFEFLDIPESRRCADIVEIDFTSLWDIDFYKDLYSFELKEVRDICETHNQMEYLINVLHSRYGSRFVDILERMHDTTITVLDGAVCVNTEAPYTINVPWMRAGYVDPYPCIKYRNEVTGFVLNSSYPTPTARRVYMSVR